MRKHFIHSGDLGDVIYSLPTIRAMGGGNLILRDMPGIQTAHGMTPQRINAIRPLLDEQSYLTTLEKIADDDEVIDLNEFRRQRRDLQNEWLPNHYLDVHGVARSEALKPWLSVKSYRVAAIIIARSARYHAENFPWRRILGAFKGFINFIGTPAEHAAFNLEFGADLPMAYTPTLLDAAHMIQACDLFIGNQSCPLAIAEGLKKPILCEVCPQCPNCISPRPDFYTEVSDAFKDHSVRRVPANDRELDASIQSVRC
jgi:hypothetical protein